MIGPRNSSLNRVHEFDISEPVRKTNALRTRLLPAACGFDGPYLELEKLDREMQHNGALFRWVLLYSIHKGMHQL